MKTYLIRSIQRARETEVKKSIGAQLATCDCDIRNAWHFEVSIVPFSFRPRTLAISLCIWCVARTNASFQKSAHTHSLTHVDPVNGIQLTESI